MQKSSLRAVIGAGRVALGPVLRSEELEVIRGLGRGIDSILSTGPVPAGAGPVLAATTKLVAAAAAEQQAAATSPVVAGPAAAGSGRIGVSCVSEIRD